MASKNSTTSTAKHPPAPAELAAFAYDSVLLLASALSMQNASSNQQLTANDVIGISCTNGVSGDISFDDMGWRITTAAYVTLYRETSNSNSLERVLIGMIKKEKGTHSKFMYINNESPSTVWSGECSCTLALSSSAIIITCSGNRLAGVDTCTCALDSTGPDAHSHQLYNTEKLGMGLGTKCY